MSYQYNILMTWIMTIIYSIRAYMTGYYPVMSALTFDPVTLRDRVKLKKKIVIKHWFCLIYEKSEVDNLIVVHSVND